MREKTVAHAGIVLVGDLQTCSAVETSRIRAACILR